MSSTIEIDNEFMTLKDIKDQFSKKFPNLKIEFFQKHHDSGEGTPETAIYDDSLELKDIRNEGSLNPISIHGNTKTSSLEEHFENEYGVNVQVYKKRGKTWIQTTSTDDWTLSEQEESTHTLTD